MKVWEMLDHIIVAMKTSSTCPYLTIVVVIATLCQRQLDEVRSCKLVFHHMPQTSTLRSGRHSATGLTSSYSARPLLQW